MTVYLRLDPPFQWVRKKDGETPSFGEVPDPSHYPIANEETVVGIVSGESVTSHRIKLPAKTRKQFNLALPFALEEVLSEDVEDLHFICPSWRANEENTVYTVAKSKMRQWADLAKQYDIPATRLVADYMLLPKHDVAQATLAVTGDSVLALDSHQRGISVDQTFAELWIKELPVQSIVAINDESFTKSLLKQLPDRDLRHWPFGERMAHWLEYGNTVDVDLWSDQFRPRSKRSWAVEFKLPIAISLVALFVYVASQVFVYSSLHQEISSITDESQSLATSIIPSVDYIEPGQERMFVERYLAQRLNENQKFNLPTTLSAIAPIFAQERVSLREIEYREGQLLIECILNNLAQIDSITRRLQAQPSFNARLQGSSTEEAGIIASFAITSALSEAQ